MAVVAFGCPETDAVVAFLTTNSEGGFDTVGCFSDGENDASMRNVH